MANTIDSLTLQLDALTKEVKSMAKLLRKVRQHQEDPTGEKAKERAANSGFNRPQRVSEALGKFLGLGADEGISRGEVTKRINAYVSANNLKDPENKRVILLDEKLKSILDVPEDKALGFTNLQTYLKPHYLGPLDGPAPAAPAVEVKQEPAAAPKKVVKKVVKKPAA